MLRRHACVTVLVLVAAVAACENHAVVASGGGTLLASRAAAVGEFPDNPLLAFAPADTPYAFASFKPVPLDVIRKMTAMARPIWRRAFTRSMSQISGADDSDNERRIAKDVFDALDTLDVKTFEDQGFSARARFAIYGIGPYPVFRVELASGDRVFNLVKRTAEHWHQPAPPPTERAGRRYWLFGNKTMAFFVAIAPKELVVAIAPRSVIDGNLADLLGEQPAPNRMTTAQLRAIAERDGFTGQGVGFIDLVRVGALVTTAAGAAPDCVAAVAAIAKRAPRLALGYDDVTLHRIAFGMVLELAPEALADARGLSGSLAGLSRLLGQKPAMAMAVAANLEHGRTVLAHVAGALGDLGQRCGVPSFVDGVEKLAAIAGRPLPPEIAGLRGGFVVVNSLKMGPHGPESIDGFGSLQLDHTGALLKDASREVPDLVVQPDGKAHALPPASPFPGHVAANEHAIGVGLGPNSATAATGALEGTPAPAPLAVIVFDYARMGDLILASQTGAEAEDVRAVIQAFGLATIQLLVDARGVVSWMSFELR
jgi:hypothetical protein